MTITVGSQLKQARTERKLSLADVTRETKIQPWVLEALESDRLQELMSSVYVKGFLSTYARFLRLVPEPLVAQLLPPPPPEPEPQPLPPPAKTRTLPAIRLHLPMPVLRRCAVAVAVCAAVAGLVVIHPVQRLSQVKLPRISLALPKIQLPKLKMPNVNATLPRMNVPKLASVTQVKASAPVKPPALQTVALAPSVPLELSVKAQRTTWIQVRADGKLLTEQRLLRGANEQWTARKKFELVVAKPSEVELLLNGQPISSFAIAHNGRLLITHRGVTKLPNEE